MHASDSRILTTHVGSLPRSPALAELLIDQEQGKAKVKEGTTVQRTPIIGRDERRVKEAQQTVHALFYSPNHALISVAYLKRGMEGARHVAPR